MNGRETGSATAIGLLILMIALFAMHGCLQQNPANATQNESGIANQSTSPTESGKPTIEETTPPTMRPTDVPSEKATAMASEQPTEKPVQPTEKTAIANPASEYCIALGFESEIRTSADGSQYGICKFADGFCDEWKFYRGECGNEQKRKLINAYYSEANASCEKNEDCEKKDMGSCAGYYPMCVNRNAKPAFNTLWCQGMMGESGFKAIVGCLCVEGKCQPT